ncbi:putative ABC transport system ATP-binding protein [Aneurinibacillus soli]|uniref:ABC transporter ATP-binding protein YxdL n=1 Tax=Aneurinibacillus soli TaxID=1500254 RepID=A0A0U5B362_9BACL|nr:ABC transporter ATP-binding protein [Aneurinibacillus soli]PYE62060.1 putative ABC transport system ATP-binding protein [Aneurinibacillus soli]BAU28752.1 ABC transporter ATP-binding protein YxdL [Aneurinibacillus soli]
MSIVLQAKGISKVYGSRGHQYTALHDMNVEIQEGEFVGVMGPSGAGKTTLLNLVATIDKPSTGSIMVDGEAIHTMNETALASFRRNKLGFIFQDFNLLDTLTLKENIILPLALAGVGAQEIEQRVQEIAQTLGLDTLLDKYPYEVSGGQKQRTAAARAIINQPKLVLADEPTGALDSKSATGLLECLSDLNKQQQATILMVTHDPFAASYCDRIFFIKDGKLFMELVKGETRKAFFNKIMDVLAVIGGGNHDTL